jgi:hypothetical protein
LRVWELAFLLTIFSLGLANRATAKVIVWIEGVKRRKTAKWQCERFQHGKWRWLDTDRTADRLARPAGEPCCDQGVRINLAGSLVETRTTTSVGHRIFVPERDCASKLRHCLAITITYIAHDAPDHSPRTLE